MSDDRRELDPNYGDDMCRLCPSCKRDEHSFEKDWEGSLVCQCGELIEGGDE